MTSPGVFNVQLPDRIRKQARHRDLTDLPEPTGGNAIAVTESVPHRVHASCRSGSSDHPAGMTCQPLGLCQMSARVPRELRTGPEWVPAEVGGIAIRQSYLIR